MGYILTCLPLLRTHSLSIPSPGVWDVIMYLIWGSLLLSITRSHPIMYCSRKKIKHATFAVWSVLNASASWSLSGWHMPRHNWKEEHQLRKWFYQLDCRQVYRAFSWLMTDMCGLAQGLGVPPLKILTALRFCRL